MKKILLILGIAVFMFTGCNQVSVSNEDYLDLMMSIVSNTEEELYIGMETHELLEVMAELNPENISVEEDGTYTFAGVDISIKNGKIAAVAVSENGYGADEIVWQTREGVVLGMTKEDVLNAYPMVAEEDWERVNRKGNYSDLKINNEIDGDQYLLGFLFDENDTLVLICIELTEK